MGESILKLWKKFIICIFAFSFLPKLLRENAKISLVKQFPLLYNLTIC